MGLRNVIGVLAAVSVAGFACTNEASDDRTAPSGDSAATGHPGGEAVDSASGGASWLTGSIAAGASNRGGTPPDISSLLPGVSGAAHDPATPGSKSCPHEVPVACRSAGDSGVFQPMGL